MATAQRSYEDLRFLASEVYERALCSPHKDVCEVIEGLLSRVEELEKQLAAKKES